MKVKSELFVYLSLVLFLFDCSPKIEKFSGKKNAQPNEEVKLFWETKNASSVEIEGIAKDLPIKGSIGVKSMETKSYSLIAKSKNGKDAISKDFEIKIIKNPLKLKYLKVSDLKTNDESPVILNWAVDYASKISLQSNRFPAKILQNSGSIELELDSTVEIHFIAENNFGEKIDSTIRIEVDKLEHFRVTEEIYRNMDATLDWKIKDVDKVDIEGIGKGLPPIGRKIIRLQETTDFILTATKKTGDKINRTVHVNVIPPKVIAFYTKNTITKNGDETIDLIWNVGGVKKIAISGIQDSVPSIGSLQIQPEEKTVYKLSFFDGEKIVMSEHVVEAFKPIWGAKQIYRGNKGMLYWNVRNGSEVSIDGIGTNLKNRDSISIDINNSQIFTLRFKRGNKLMQFDHKVRVVRDNFISNIVPYEQANHENRLYFDIFSFDRSNYPKEVKFKVIVTDEKGNYIQNLASTDELIKKYFLGLVEKVENQSYTIQNFKVTEFKEMLSKPYSFGISMDYSGSMSGVIQYAEQGVKTLINEKQPKDEVSIVKFDHKLSRQVELAKDTAEIFGKVKFEGLKDFGGSTALYAGGDEGLKSLANSDKNKVLILFTDGHENSSMQYFGTHAFKAGTLVGNARKQNTKIFPIAFGNGVNDDLLDELAMLTDGSAYFVTNQDDIDKVYKELPRLFKNYYEISYTPIQKEGVHSIELEFFNQKTGKDKTIGQTHIGENYTIDRFDMPDDYGYVNGNGQKAVSAPQAIAFFEYDNYRIDEKYIPNLLNFARYMKMNTKSTIEILGHTDMVGSEEDCMILAEKRAGELKKLLIKEGIDPSRIKAIPFGKTRPVWQVEDQPWKAQENRRIEVQLFE